MVFNSFRKITLFSSRMERGVGLSTNNTKMTHFFLMIPKYFNVELKEKPFFYKIPEKTIKNAFFFFLYKKRKKKINFNIKVVHP